MQVDVVDNVPLVVGHVGEGLVTEDTSIVDENVDATPSVDSCLDDSLTVLNISLVANSLTAELLDLLDNIVRVDEIVDDDLCATLGQLQRVDAAETSTATSDDSDLSGKVELLTFRVRRKLASFLKQLEGICRTLGVLSL